MRRIVSKTLRGYLQGISGLFISPNNPNGLTPTELDVLTAVVFVLDEEAKTQVTAATRTKVAELTNYPRQVITNYIKKFRDKRVLDNDNRLHQILTEREISIKYTKTEEGKNNVQSGGVLRSS